MDYQHIHKTLLSGSQIEVSNTLTELVSYVTHTLQHGDEFERAALSLSLVQLKKNYLKATTPQSVLDALTEDNLKQSYITGFLHALFMTSSKHYHHSSFPNLSTFERAMQNYDHYITLLLNDGQSILQIVDALQLSEEKVLFHIKNMERIGAIQGEVKNGRVIYSLTEKALGVVKKTH